MPDTACSHLAAVTDVTTDPETSRVCAECVKSGGRWVHLRTCQACGGTHCCDSSPNRHARAHWHATQHPVIASAEPGERWLWCYEDEQYAAY